MYCRHALWRIVGIVAGSLLRQCVRSSSNAQLQAVSVCNACLCRLFQLAMHACAGCFSLQCMFLQLFFGPILRSHHFPPCRGGRQIGGSSHGRLIQLAAVGGGPAGGSGRSPQPKHPTTPKTPSPINRNTPPLPRLPVPYTYIPTLWKGWSWGPAPQEWWRRIFFRLNKEPEQPAQPEAQEETRQEMPYHRRVHTERSVQPWRTHQPRRMSHGKSKTNYARSVPDGDCYYYYYYHHRWACVGCSRSNSRKLATPRLFQLAPVLALHAVARPIVFGNSK